MRASSVKQWVFHLTNIYMDFSGAGDSEDSSAIMAHATIHMGVAIPQLLRGASRICPAHSTLTVLRHSAFCYCTANG